MASAVAPKIIPASVNALRLDIGASSKIAFFDIFGLLET
jgi:hypothetical protein